MTPQWQPISSAPKNGALIIVAGGIARWYADRWYTLTGFDYPGKPIMWEVTHWQPLPPPPGEEPTPVETCWICGKLRGRPPERCNGHYEGTSSDPKLRQPDPQPDALAELEWWRTPRRRAILSAYEGGQCRCELTDYTSSDISTWRTHLGLGATFGAAIFAALGKTEGWKP